MCELFSACCRYPGNVTVILNTIGTSGNQVPYLTNAFNMTIGSIGLVYAGVLPVGQAQPVNVTTPQNGFLGCRM